MLKHKKIEHFTNKTAELLNRIGMERNVKDDTYVRQSMAHAYVKIKENKKK